MIGAILGDIIGSPYEFDLGDKTKDFPLFSKKNVWVKNEVFCIQPLILCHFRFVLRKTAPHIVV